MASDPSMKTCPECAEEIKLEARVCRYCGTTFALASVGYCIRCHKVTATSELGVCAVCGSRLIDVHIESRESSGPTVGSPEEKPGVVIAPAAAPTAGVVPAAPSVAEAPAAVEPTSTAPEIASIEPAPVSTEPEPEPESVEPESTVASAWLPAAPPEPDLPPAPPPPPGIAWNKSGPPATEPATTPLAPEKPVPEPGQPPVGQSSDIVAERLAAFGRRETPAQPLVPAPPSAGPPVTTPPGPAVTPTPGPFVAPAAHPPVAPIAGNQEAAVAREATPREHVEASPVPVKEEPAPTKPVESVDATERRAGIVPSLAQRAAYPFYLLAVIAVLAMWLINYYWHHNLEGTSRLGSQTLSNFIVATYDGGMTLVSWQIGLIAVICGLLIPTRLLPKGWFRERGVAKEFAKELKAEFGVDAIFKQRWFVQKLMLAFVLWAIALADLVATLVRHTSFVLKTGGYVTIGALLVGFACSGVLVAKRKPVVEIDERGRIKH